MSEAHWIREVTRYAIPKELILHAPLRCTPNRPSSLNLKSRHPKPKSPPRLRDRTVLKPYSNFKSASRDAVNTKRPEVRDLSANKTPSNAKATNENRSNSLAFTKPAPNLQSRTRPDVHHAPQNTGWGSGDADPIQSKLLCVVKHAWWLEQRPVSVFPGTNPGAVVGAALYPYV